MADLDDLVDAWHTSGPQETRPLHEYLGMTREQYARWATTGERPDVDRARPSCEHCGGSGHLLIEDVITDELLTTDQQPPYWSACHCPDIDTRTAADPPAPGADEIEQRQYGDPTPEETT